MQSRNFTRCWSTILGLTFLSMSGIAAAGAGSYVAGTQPSERPVKAPVLGSIQKTPAWFYQAFRGVEEPYPNTLLFMGNQGRWYTPFVHPGMPGKYDIRGWHQ